MSCFSWFNIYLLLPFFHCSFGNHLVIVIENFTQNYPKQNSCGPHMATRCMAGVTKQIMSGGQACCSNLPTMKGQLLGCGQAKLCIYIYVFINILIDSLAKSMGHSAKEGQHSKAEQSNAKKSKASQSKALLGKEKQHQEKQSQAEIVIIRIIYVAYFLLQFQESSSYLFSFSPPTLPRQIGTGSTWWLAGQWGPWNRPPVPTCQLRGDDCWAVGSLICVTQHVSVYANASIDPSAKLVGHSAKEA